MDFERIKWEVDHFLSDSTRKNPTDALNAYFRSISEERRIWQAEELLDLVAKSVSRPQTAEDLIRAGNVGAIAMGVHYAYPLLLTVLGWWVYAVYNIATAKELTQEEKNVLYSRLSVGIRRWDWNRLDAHQYDHLLNKLVLPRGPAQASQTKKLSIFQGLKRLLRISGASQTP